MAGVIIKAEISSAGKWIKVIEPVTMQGYTVPAGFVSDLDTIRRIPIIYVWLKDRARVPALMHDYLYTIGVQRKQADMLFLTEMEYQGVNRFYRYPIYWGVRLFGRFFYVRR